ncbi:cupin domain-containing protein [Streptomyces cucumeris]|uniref:cupin domain-containing protein n=1 Tax=Streptomyces cucumeris TaxID=2962890 RepID=UPI003D72BF12
MAQHPASALPAATATALTGALRLTGDGPDGWFTGPWHDTTLADGTCVMRRRTLLRTPGSASVWRRSTADTVLFFHTGTPAAVVTSGPGATDTTVLGADAAVGQVAQCTVPAGTWHALAPLAEESLLWSEASVPGDAEWQTADPARLPDPEPPAADVRAPRASGTTAELLGMTAHVEGGYFLELYSSAGTVRTPVGTRLFANTIHYLLDSRSPVGHLHGNVSDITHFLHSGGPITYLMLAPDGRLEKQVLGWDADRGQVPVFTCPGGWWKTSFLPEGVSEGLISEIVAPGFDFADQRMATAQDLVHASPDDARRLAPYLSH